MSKKRRNHSPEFKSKVALVAIRRCRNCPGNMLIVKWKKQLIEQSRDVFASSKGVGAGSGI